MKLNLRKVGDVTHMEAEGKPEEIASFVALIETQVPRPIISTVVMSHSPAIQINRTITARGPVDGVGSVTFER